mmetsp:Transcript_30418/g.69633  ORF Transcript_30418/g.69633 Transcript_30418/m.69633 type:complete len:89 (+) Transcript_30418:369-635(+)
MGNIIKQQDNWPDKDNPKLSRFEMIKKIAKHQGIEQSNGFDSTFGNMPCLTLTTPKGPIQNLYWPALPDQPILAFSVLMYQNLLLLLP